MGPALLPTPLSPACGCSDLARPPANLRSCIRQRILSRPVSSLSLPRLATGFARDLSPALAPASGSHSCQVLRPPPDRSPRIFAALHIRSCRGRVPLPMPSHRGWGLSPFPLRSRMARSLACPMPPSSALLSASRLAFSRSVRHVVSRRARDHMSPPSLGSKAWEFQGLAAFRSRCSVSRRQVESAPESAI